MWVRPVLIALSLSIGLLAQAYSQRGDGPPERRRFSRPMHMMREIHRVTPNREILGMLFHRPIRTEVEFSDEQFDAFNTQMRSSFDEMRSLWRQEREGEINREELKARMLEAMKKADQEARDLLNDQQFLRLLGLYVQHRGAAAAENVQVAQRIGLSGEELSEFRRSRWQIKRELIEMNQARLDRILKTHGEDTPKNIERLFAEIDDNVNERLASHLSEAQLAKLEALKGEPFADLPPARFGWGPPPRSSDRGEPDRGYCPSGRKPSDEGHDSRRHRDDRHHEDEDHRGGPPGRDRRC